MDPKWIARLAALVGIASAASAACDAFDAEPAPAAGAPDGSVGDAGSDGAALGPFCARKYGPTSTLFCDDFEGRAGPDDVKGPWDGVATETGRATLTIGASAVGGSVLVAQSDESSEQQAPETFLSKRFTMTTRARLAFDADTVRPPDNLRTLASLVIDRSANDPRFQVYMASVKARTIFSQQTLEQPDGSNAFPTETLKRLEPPPEGFHHYEIEIDVRVPSKVYISVDGAPPTAHDALVAALGNGDVIARVGLSYAGRARPVASTFDNVVVEVE